jgi:hypothetical protein
MERVTLELVEEAFCSWRAQRSSPSEPIPDKLWVMALTLYPEYKRSKICEQLHLSGSQFKRRLEGSSPTFADNGFVLASKDNVKALPKPSQDIQLIIQGKERALSLCVDVHALSQLLPHLGALL